MIDYLERRRILSASIINSVLVIDGSSQADTITITVAAGNATVDIQPEAFNLAFDMTLFNTFELNASDSGDTINISNDFSKPGTINGGTGADTINGGAGAEVINGQNDDDSIVGGAGDDTLDGGAGADVLDAGDGTDTATYASRSNPVFVTFAPGSNGDDGEASEGDTLLSNIETVIGGSGNDNLSNANTVDTRWFLDGAGNDTVTGGSGDDTFETGGGSDSYIGGGGRDAVLYFDRTNAVSISLDGAANDGESGENDSIASDIEKFGTGTGNDTINLAASNADMLVVAGAGNDVITTADGADTIQAEAGNDSITTGAGADTVDCADGNDTVVAGAGNDTVSGGLGDDSIDGGTGADTLNGDAGLRDTVTYGTRTNQVQLYLDNTANDGETAENDNIGSDFEIVIAGSGNDRISVTVISTGVSLYGNAGNDTLLGGTGPDRLNGSTGNDDMRGIDGDDTLIGGSGADKFNGGIGTDTATYYYTSNPVKVSLDDGTNDGIGKEKDNVKSDMEIVIGGNGNDVLTASTNAIILNTLIGGLGNDSFFSNNGKADSLDGGGGTDTADSDGADTLTSIP